MSEHDEPNIPAGLKSLRSLKIEPSPFLASRVEANWRASLKPAPTWREQWGRWLIPLALGAFIATAALHWAPSLNSDSPTPTAAYALHQPYMIRVDVRELPREEVAYAEIDLDGESAHFTSKKFAAIADHRRLTIPGEALSNKQYLPIIVEGEKDGATTVTANFYNANHELIATKTLTLRFKGATI